MSFSERMERLMNPVESPVFVMTMYYLLLVLVAAVLLWIFPGAREIVSGERLAELAGGGGARFAFTNPSPSESSQWLSWQFALSLGASMIGAFLLMVPSTWVYMATRNRKGFDQTIVHTMVILAVAVSGVVVIVRNSIALAFSLAGIVGAVRFRNSLRDTQDTLYIFLSIGVGLATGVEALAAGLIFSIVFNYLVLLLYGADYGFCAIGSNSGHVLFTKGEEGAADIGKKKQDFNAVMLVRTKEKNKDKAQQVMEQFLAGQTKRWRLADVGLSGNVAVLKYLIRLRKSVNRGDFEDAALAIGGDVVTGTRIH